MIGFTGLLLPSPAAATALSAGAHAAPALVNCVGSAAGFFGNVRTPAALLAGAALGNLWISVKSEGASESQSNLYTLLIALTVALQFGCVFVATAAGVQVCTFIYLSSPMVFRLGKGVLTHVAMATQACSVLPQG